MLHVLVTSFNGVRWLARCIGTIRSQSVSDWHCSITDDQSTDDSVAVAKRVTSSDERFEVIANTQKLYQTGNYHQILTRPDVDDDDIVVPVDGDDWLPDRHVFERVLDAYSDGNTWLSYGSHVNSWTDGKLELGYARLHPDVRRARFLAWTTGQLRMFKAFLWRSIHGGEAKVSGTFY